MNDEAITLGFKETDIGVIPNNWKAMKLGEVVNVFDKMRVPVREEERARQKKVYPYCGANGIIDYVEDYLFDGEYLLVAEDGGHWGRLESSSYIMSGRFWVNNHAHILMARSKYTTNHFLMYALNHQDLTRYVGGDARGKVNQSVLRDVVVPIPPLVEQQRVVSILTSIQNTRKKTESVISALKELRKSMMKHLFTYGPVPEDHIVDIQTKDTDVGEVPRHWRIMKFGSLCSLRKEAAHPGTSPDSVYVGLEHLDPGEVRIIRTGLSEGLRSSKSVFLEGDVLYGKLRPYLDKAALAHVTGMCSTDILVMIPTDGMITGEYLAHLVHTRRFLEFAIRTTTGVNHPRTSWSALKELTLAVPPIEEQREVSDALQAVDDLRYLEAQRVRALEVAFATLLGHLMTGRLRVNNLEVPA